MENTVEGQGEPGEGEVVEENENGETQEGNVLPNANQHGSGAEGSTAGGIVPDAATQAAIGLSQAIAAGPPGFAPGLLELINAAANAGRATAPGGTFDPGNVLIPGLATAAGRTPNVLPPVPTGVGKGNMGEKGKAGDLGFLREQLTAAASVGLPGGTGDQQQTPVMAPGGGKVLE